VLDVMTELESWWQEGASVVVGTVVATWRSAPRQPGAVMVVGPEDTVVGSVSGGCVEGDLFEVARSVRDSGQPLLRRYGVSDDDAFAVGLTCGGTIDVFVERIDRNSFPELGDVARDIRAGRPVAVATLVGENAGGVRTGRRLIVRDDAPGGSLGSARLDAAVRDDALGMLVKGRSGILHYGPDGERRGDDISVFVATYAPRPRMIVFGAIDFAAAMARIGSFLGYRVTVCDARATFATARRFPDADEVVVQWPHRYLQTAYDRGEVDARTVVCVLTHDPKFDVPLLELALRIPLAYVGAMGSRRTNDDRTDQLRGRGLTEAELSRLHAPIGLDVGARTPEETAVSIAAEITALRWGGSGTQLRSTEGPIHHDIVDSGPITATGSKDQRKLDR
jgi:xanthine dehydrogenase accessory factor